MWVRLALQNFASIAKGGGNAAPKISKISTFFVNSRPIGATLLTTLKIFTGFYTPQYPTLVFKFHVIRIIGYGVIPEKPRVGKLGQFLCAPSRKNYALYQKWMAPFMMGTTSSIAAQSAHPVPHFRRPPYFACGVGLWT